MWLYPPSNGDLSSEAHDGVLLRRPAPAVSSTEIAIAVRCSRCRGASAAAESSPGGLLGSSRWGREAEVMLCHVATSTKRDLGHQRQNENACPATSISDSASDCHP